MSSTDIPPRATHPFQHDFVRWRAEKLSAPRHQLSRRCSACHQTSQWSIGDPKRQRVCSRMDLSRYSSAWAQLAEGRGDNVGEERAQSDWLQEFCLAFGLRTQERSLFAPKTGFTRLTVGKQGSGGYSPFSNRARSAGTPTDTRVLLRLSEALLCTVSRRRRWAGRDLFPRCRTRVYPSDHYRSAFDAVLTRPIMQIPANRDTKAGERATVTACVIDHAGLTSVGPLHKSP